MCLIYLSWFQERLPPGSFIMRPSTPHRVFLAALMMAHKVYNDNSVNNTCWAECSAFPECGFAGFSNVEVNLIEKEFLSFLDWEVHISPDLYDAVSRVVHTPSYPPYPLQTELPWACECCICINGYANSAQGLWHCFACLPPGYADVEMSKKVLSAERSQFFPTDQSFTALHHQAASLD